MKECRKCGGLLPSSNRTWICVACTEAAKTPAEHLAKWERIAAEQRRIQGAAWPLIEAAAQAEEELGIEALDGGSYAYPR